MSLTQLEMVRRGTLFRLTLKLKEVLNKQILSASQKFSPRSCCSNLKQPQSGINIRMQAGASPVDAWDAGGAGGAGGAGSADGAGGVGKRYI